MLQKLTTSLGIATLMVAVPLQVEAVGLTNRFNNIYVFGDSLSDTGNVSELTQNIFPPTPYQDGRFSNGDVWIDYLARDLGLASPTPLAALTPQNPPNNGINFAFGGATTGTANTIDSQFPGVQGQVQRFGSLSTVGVPVDPNGLHILWAGANDYLPTESNFEPYLSPDVPVRNLESTITNLANLGAKNFLVANLPDLGKTPLALGYDEDNRQDSKGHNSSALDPTEIDVSQRLDRLTRSHNQQLSQSLDTLRSQLGSEVTIAEFDVNAAFNEVLGNPANFGFSNVTDPCIFSGMCAVDPTQQEQYFFWDNTHPTTRGHEITANYALAGLTKEFSQPKPVPEGYPLLGIIAVGLGCVGGALRRQVR
ncbi:MAG: SGNH/GDSL hydrolase family protein [Spirulinaceae cyanobacterium]